MLAFIIKVLFSCFVGLTIIGGLCMFAAMILDCNDYEEDENEHNDGN